MDALLVNYGEAKKFREWTTRKAAAVMMNRMLIRPPKSDWKERLPLNVRRTGMAKRSCCLIKSVKDIFVF